MRRLLAAVVLAATSIALISGIAFAAEGPTGSIKGTLANKTAGGASVAGLDVTLGTYKGTEDAGKKTVKAGSDGSFAFEGLETAADYTYQLSVKFQDADYYSEPINFGAAGDTSTAKTVDLQVFDSTADGSVLKAAAHHYVIDPDPSGVSVTEMVIIANGSDKAFIGASNEAHAGARATLRFALAQGATDFQPLEGLYPGRTLTVEGGFVDTLPVFPGMAQKVWQYRVPASADAVSTSVKLTMPSEKISVLVPEVGARVAVSGAGLSSPASQDFQGQKFLVFSGQNAPSDAEIQFKVEDLSKVTPPPAAGAAAAPASTDSNSTTLVFGGIVAVLAVAGGLTFAVVRRRRDSQVDMEALEAEYAETAQTYRGGNQDLETERRSLVAAIARLDDLFEQDKIGSEEYGRLRTEKKRLLIEVVKRQKDGKASARAGE